MKKFFTWGLVGIGVLTMFSLLNRQPVKTQLQTAKDKAANTAGAVGNRITHFKGANEREGREAYAS